MEARGLLRLYFKHANDLEIYFSALGINSSRGDRYAAFTQASIYSNLSVNWRAVPLLRVNIGAMRKRLKPSRFYGS
jgi:hypothetical protein